MPSACRELQSCSDDSEMCLLLQGTLLSLNYYRCLMQNQLNQQCKFKIEGHHACLKNCPIPTKWVPCFDRAMSDNNICTVLPTTLSSASVNLCRGVSFRLYDIDNSIEGWFKMQTRCLQETSSCLQTCVLKHQFIIRSRCEEYFESVRF